MSPYGEPVGDRKIRRGGSERSNSIADDGQWEDFTCATRWEDFIRVLEDVLQDWQACDTDLVEPRDDDLAPAAPPSRPRTSYSRCLEHDGQLFSIQLIPQPDLLRFQHAPQATAPAAALIRTASAACGLENRELDFAREGVITPVQRWFGLRQYVLVRALGHSGPSSGIGIDELLWAATVASANRRCSLPMLVSSDWDGLESEAADARGRGGDVGGGERKGIGSNATCKGYSAPGSKGVACSVRFQTALTEKAPLKCLYLDGLTDLFLSKVRDAHALPSHTFAPRVSTTVQQAWEWMKPEAEALIPAPGLPLERAPYTKRSSDSTREGSAENASDGNRVRGLLEEFPVTSKAGWQRRVVAATDVSRDTYGRRKAVVGRLLRDIGGSEEDILLWGPNEDPLVSICVRARWAELREGLVEESEHYTTLDPLPEARESSLGTTGGSGSSAAKWFVSARWRQQGGEGGSSKPLSADGRLGDACFRLLAALVLTTTMHPGTLMADLGAAAEPDSPMALAEDYGKAAAAMLSAETRASVEGMCTYAPSTSIDHDRIDSILLNLLHPKHADNASGDPLNAASQTVAAEDSGRVTTAGGGGGEGHDPPWKQVYPRERPQTHGPEWQQGYTGARHEGDRRKARENSSSPLATTSLDAIGGVRCGDRRLGIGEQGARDEPEMSLWAWAERGGTPIGRLLSLLSLRVADCDNMRSMSLLWMSFVRDVRLLWEDGATIARMEAIPEVDGASMFDRGMRGTGQSKSVAAQLRGRRVCDADLRGLGLYSSAGGCHSRLGMVEARQVCSGGWGQDLPPFPDTRTCLIWQKLQMLNCCRIERGESAAVPDDWSDPREDHYPRQRLGREDGGAGSDGAVDTSSYERMEDGEEGEDEDEDEMFFDSKEYYQPSEEGGTEMDGGGRGQKEGREGERGGDGRGGVDEGTIGRGRDGGNDGGGGGGGYGQHSGDGIDAGVDEVEDEEEEEEEREGPCSLVSRSEVSAATVVEDEGEASPPESGPVNVLSTAARPIGEPNGKEREAGEAGDCVGGNGLNGVSDCERDVARERSTVTVAVDAPLSSASPHDAAVVLDFERNHGEGHCHNAGAGGSTVDNKAVCDGVGCGTETTVCSGEKIAASAGRAEETAAVGDEATVATPPDRKEQVDCVLKAGAEKITSGEPQRKDGVKEDGDPGKAGTVSNPSTQAQPTDNRDIAIDAPSSSGRGTPPAVPRAVSPFCPGTGDLRLLCTGEVVRSPSLVPSGPLTGDMLEQQRLGHAGAYRGREVLAADMHAFREENRRAVFADFVRWYRPECWQAAFEGGEWRSASEDRAGGSLQDDHRLAWPGQGQVLWRGPAAAPGEEIGGIVPCLVDPAAWTGTPSPGSPFALATWFSCWGEAAVKQGERRVRSVLFSGVKEGEKALHYLETISPGPLLMQLLSAVLGLSVFLLQEASKSAEGLPAAQAAADAARRKAVAAVELLATTEKGAHGVAKAQEVVEEGATARPDSQEPCNSNSSSSPFRQALLAADAACLEVKKAEITIARAISLERSLPGQKELANAIVACEAEGRVCEAPVESRAQKEFLRDLLLAQDMIKTPSDELEDLLASYDEEDHQHGEDGGGGDGKKTKEHGGGGHGGKGAMPPPHTREYVLRCQTPSPFYGRNVGRRQMEAYPTPSSRMYAKTDRRHLRVALSLCESEV